MVGDKFGNNVEMQRSYGAIKDSKILYSVIQNSRGNFAAVLEKILQLV